MADGTAQTPGGWNNISIDVEDLDSIVEKLRKAGSPFEIKLLWALGESRLYWLTHQEIWSRFSSIIRVDDSLVLAKGGAVPQYETRVSKLTIWRRSSLPEFMT